MIALGDGPAGEQRPGTRYPYTRKAGGATPRQGETRGFCEIFILLSCRNQFRCLFLRCASYSGVRLRHDHHREMHKHQHFFSPKRVCSYLSLFLEPGSTVYLSWQVGQQKIVTEKKNVAPAFLLAAFRMPLSLIVIRSFPSRVTRPYRARRVFQE